MNLRDKLRAVGGTGGSPRPAGEASTDCRHFAVYRPAEEFPGAYDLSAETLRMMSDRELPEDLDPRRFFRISRSCIVSMKAIRHITRHFAGRLVLETEPRPPFEMTVSRARVDDFLSWLKS